MLADILRKFQWYLKYAWISFLFLLFVRARDAIQAGSILKYSKSEMKQFWCFYWDFSGPNPYKIKKGSYRKSIVFFLTFQYSSSSTTQHLEIQIFLENGTKIMTSCRNFIRAWMKYTARMSSIVWRRLQRARDFSKVFSWVFVLITQLRISAGGSNSNHQTGCV